MGFFSINRFEQPGAGVDKDAPQKKRFFLFWEIFGRKFWKLIPLSLLYTVMCIPIVTIGPATAGLMYVLRNFSQEQHAYVASDFFDAFKKNWKQSFVFGLLDLVAVVLLVTAIPFYYGLVVDQKQYLFILPLSLTLTGAFIVLCMNFYMPLMIVSLKLNMKQMLKNAFLLTFAAVKTNIITALISALFIGLFVVLIYPIPLPIFLWMYLFIMAVLGFAFLGLVISFNSYPAILKYVVDPYYAKQNRLKPIEETVEDADDAPIFEDIGSREKPMKLEKNKKNRTIR